MSKEILKRAKDLIEHHDRFGADGDAEACLPVIRELVAALELSGWAVERLEKKTTSPQVKAFAAFGQKIYLEHRDGGPNDVDGATLQEAALATGLLKEVLVDEPCHREGCDCAETTGFPARCCHDVFLFNPDIGV